MFVCVVSSLSRLETHSYVALAALCILCTHGGSIRAKRRSCEEEQTTHFMEQPAREESSGTSCTLDKEQIQRDVCAVRHDDPSNELERLRGT